MEWLRWYHGAISDTKWPLIARKANVSVGVVVSIWAALLEHASQDEERGSIAGFDCETIDALFGYDDGMCAAVVAAMEAKKIIFDGCIAAWCKRQPKREKDDSSAARVKRHRDKKFAEQENLEETACCEHVTPCNATVTPCNATVTPCNAQNREEKRRKEEEECVFNAHAQVAISVPEMPIQTTAQEVPPAAFSSSPDVGFEDFFDAFPARHRGSEAKAAEVWQALRLNRAFPGLSRVLHSLEAWKASDQWLAQGGRFIPSAENFLAKEYWQRDPGLPQSQQPRGQPRASSLRQQQMQNADTVAQMLLAKRKSKEESHRRNRNANNPNDATGLLGNAGQSFSALPASVPYTCTAS